MTPVDVKLFFNFRSPYCYLASKTMWSIFDDYHTKLIWKPVGGWDLRSPPSRAKVKVPLTRQDIARYGKRLGIPVNPPPIETEPTAAGAASLFAEQQGKLREYIVETLRIEWAEGRNIGEDAVLVDVAHRIGLDSEALLAAAHDPDNRAVLERNAKEAEEGGIIGVPTFVIGDNIFWGQDRIEFVLDELRELRVAKC